MALRLKYPLLDAALILDVQELEPLVEKLEAVYGGLKDQSGVSVRDLYRSVACVNDFKY